MKLKIERVPLQNYVGGLLGKIIFTTRGYDNAYWANDKISVITKGDDYISVRLPTDKVSRPLLKEIAMAFLGTYSVNITSKEKNIFQIRKKAKNEKRT